MEGVTFYTRQRPSLSNGPLRSMNSSLNTYKIGDLSDFLGLRSPVLHSHVRLSQNRIVNLIEYLFEVLHSTYIPKNPLVWKIPRLRLP